MENIGIDIVWPFGIFYDHLEYFTTIRNILRTFGIFTTNWEYFTVVYYNFGRLVLFVVIWYILPVLVCLDLEKSGNPGDVRFRRKHTRLIMIKPFQVAFACSHKRNGFVGSQQRFSTSMAFDRESCLQGRCYDHNFLRFSPIFGEKIGVFLKKQCSDQCFHNLALFLVEKTPIYLQFFLPKIFFKS
jgi:hypothetical protein